MRARVVAPRPRLRPAGRRVGGKLGWRVICPDLVGRGQQRLAARPGGVQPAAIRHRHNGADCPARRRPRWTWIGTSLGGLVGMTLACLPNTPIDRHGHQRYRPVPAVAGVASPRQFRPRLTARNSPPSRPPIAFYRHQPRAVRHPIRRRNGSISTRHNLFHSTHRRHLPASWPIRRSPPPSSRAGISTSAFGASGTPIACPVLVLRGSYSDLLLAVHRQARCPQRGPTGRQSYVIPECGHAPALLDGPGSDRAHHRMASVRFACASGSVSNTCGSNARSDEASA